VPGLDIAAAYRPAGDGSVVGGDFYDVFQVSPDAWVVVVGDVEGKGTSAATVTAFVRHQVRALTMQHDDPAEVLARLNAVLLAHEAQHFCTLVLARLDPADGGWLVRLALGGHPHPLLSDGDATVTEVGVPGSLVGVLPDAEFTTAEVLLVDGALTLFTDGVTEARSDAGLYGEERLVEVVQRASAQDAHGLNSTIVADVLAYQSGRAADDIAVITLAAPRRPGPH
jgi:sigma-B regulation protein RsbU (phosphoserine phosphatase)